MYGKGVPELKREANIQIYREEPRPLDGWDPEISAAEGVIRDCGSQT